MRKSLSILLCSLIVLLNVAAPVAFSKTPCEQNCDYQLYYDVKSADYDYFELRDGCSRTGKYQATCIAHIENIYRLEIGIARFSHGICFRDCKQAELNKANWFW
jgi:hypothetical protein